LQQIFICAYEEKYKMKPAEGLIISAMIMTTMLVINGPCLAASLENGAKGLNQSEISTTWDLSSLFKSSEDANAEFLRLQTKSQEINATFRPLFENLSGTALLGYIEAGI
jgi:hypothetical protein